VYASHIRSILAGVRQDAPTDFVHTGTAGFVAALTFALPAWAHGEQILALYFGALLFVPAAGFLLIPWCRWWARIAATTVLSGLTIVAWFVDARMVTRNLTAATELLILGTHPRY